MSINSFKGEHRFLSNFWLVQVEYADHLFPSVENAYQAAKCADPADHRLFLQCSPGEAKRLGRHVKMRGDWNDVRVAVMYTLLQRKFKNPLLAELLKLTGDQPLIEGNTWGDTFWGVCRGVGKNQLGVLLMKVRSEL